MEDCRHLIALVRAAAMQPHLLPVERLKHVDAEARLLTLLQRLEVAQELREERYCYEHPAFLRAARAIAAALEPYPQAARAVNEVLTKLGV
jgi:hypothetical protein